MWICGPRPDEIRRPFNPLDSHGANCDRAALQYVCDFGRALPSASLNAVHAEEAKSGPSLTTECPGGLRGDRFRRRNSAWRVLSLGIRLKSEPAVKRLK